MCMYVWSTFHRLIEEENQINIPNHKYIYVVKVLVYSSFFFFSLFFLLNLGERQREKRKKIICAFFNSQPP